MLCLVCYRRSVAALPVCPYCGAFGSSLRIDPITPNEALGIGAAFGVVWVLKQYHKHILRPFIIDPLMAVLAQRQLNEIKGDLERMIHAFENSDYKKALAIGKSISIPEHYPDQIKAKYVIFLGLAQFQENDSLNALQSFEQFTKIQTKLGAETQILGMGHLLIAEACYKSLSGDRTRNTSLIERGLASMNHVINKLAPDEEFYALRALLYCAHGEKGPAKRDADLALELDPNNLYAKKVLEMLSQLSR